MSDIDITRLACPGCGLRHEARPVTTVEVSHRHDTDACDVCNAIWQMGRDDTAALREAAQAVVDWFADVEGSRLDCLDALRAALEANRE